MMCFAAALGLLGIAAMRRAHRSCHGHDGYGWYGPFGHGEHGWRGRGSRRMVYALFRRIDASPAQERAIIAEIDKLQDRVRAAKAGVHGARADLAAALRGPVLDDAALGAALGRVDAALGEARSAMIDALRGVHGALDDRQRAHLADLLEHRGGWWRSSPTF
jgi:Spy/CpxP family protein refolding chaperone